jgi:hypothetical protein
VDALATALAYVERLNWPVFPRPEGRFIGHGYKDATKDTEQIREWWTRWPNALISIPTGPTSGIIVLDIDCKNGKNGFDTLDEIGKATLPETPMVYTPHDGLHLYFAENLNLNIGCSENAIGPGLDVRGHGGSIAVPTPGWRYRWDDTYRPSLVAFRPAPGWLAVKQKRDRSDNSYGTNLDPYTILAAACTNIRNAGPGDRNRVLNREAFLIGCLVRVGALPRAEALHELEAATLTMTTGTSGNNRKASYDLNRAFDQGRNKGGK